MIVLVASALAAQVQVDVDTRRLQVGETTQLRLTVVGGGADHTPDIPDVDGLRIAWVGSRQSTVMVNFRTQRVVTYVWSVTALREGVHTVGPVDVSVAGEPLQAASVELTVAARETAPGEGLSGSLPDSAWEGQVMVQELVYRGQRRVLDSSWSLPPYEGILPEPTSRPTERQYTTQVDNQSVQVVELLVPLRMSRAGTHAIPPTVLTVQVPAERQRSRPRFGMGVFTEVESEVFSSPGQTVTVRPLPEQGRSEHWSGLVGQFELEATLTDATIAAGDSTTLIVRVQGDGSLGGFSLPPSVGQGFRAYDDDPELELRLDDDGFFSRMTLRRAIVPEGPGELVLPALVLQVFDPVAEAYVDLSVPEQVLQVSPGEEGASELQAYSDGQLDRRGEVADLGEDILPIHAGAGGSDLPSWWMLLAGLPGLLACLRGLRRGPSQEDPRAALRARLRDASEDPGELEGLFREALGLALDRPAAGLERVHLAALPEALREPCERLYADIEATRYGGAPADLRARVVELGERLCS